MRMRNLIIRRLWRCPAVVMDHEYEVSNATGDTFETLSYLCAPTSSDSHVLSSFSVLTPYTVSRIPFRLNRSTYVVHVAWTSRISDRSGY